MRNYLLALLCIAFLLKPCLADDELKKELEKLQGIWILEKQVEQGKETSKEELKKVTLEIKGNEMKFVGGRESGGVPFRINPNKVPAEIDTFTFLGIYKLDGDKLTFVFARDKGERPTRFEEGKEVTLLLLKKSPK